MNVGCIVLVRRNGKLLGVECNKGRGYILPGGKWEPGETFVEAAAREFREETGLQVKNLKLVFQGPDGFGYLCLCFTGQLIESAIDPKAEMIPVEVTWEQLKQSKYSAYYDLLQMEMEKRDDSQVW